MFSQPRFPKLQKVSKHVLTAVCATAVILLISAVGHAQTPTPTPITKPDPPTVQTPSTVGKIPKWTGVSKSGIGIIGDSVMTESGGNVGIDVTNPTDKLTVGGSISATAPINTGSYFSISGNRVLFLDFSKFNLFAGYQAGTANTTGERNAFFGYNAGVSNNTGTANSLFGVFAGFSNTSGSGNSFFGLQAGFSNSSGNSNSFFGTTAGNLNTTGSQNAFFGNAAGYRTTIGNFNTFVGSSSGFNNTTGANNTFFGLNAGQSNTTESNNTLIGANSNGAAGITNATALGANSVVTQSNSIVLGNNANVGIGTSAPQAKLHVIGSTAGRFDGNVTINGNLAVTGTANLTADNALHANAADTAINFTGSLAGDVTGTQNVTVVSSIGGKSAANVASATDAANNASSSNTANNIVKRDGAGNFSAGTITGNFNGNATTATTADSANSLANTAIVNGDQVNGALTKATIPGSAVTGNVAASQVTGELTNATISGYVAKSGDTMTGTLTLPANGLAAGTNQLVLSSGNVGIGVTNPTSKLEVAGTVKSTDVSANNVTLPNGTIKGTPGSPLVVQGSMGNGGSTGGYLSLDPGGFYYPGGGIKLSAGATAPDYNSVPGAFITLDGDGYNTGGDIMIASGHAYGANTGGAITLNVNGAYAGNNPSPGHISLQIQGNESLRVASNGNVGIGTATPQAKFQVTNNGGTAGQFDGNVTVNGNLTVTGTTNLASAVNHDSTLTGSGTAASPLSVVAAPNGVVTTGSYANPSWITSIDGNKLTAGTVVKSLNGISDNVTLAAGDNVTITPSGNTLTISATASSTPQYNPNQVALLRWYEVNQSGASFGVGNRPFWVASDGSHMWVTNANDGSVTKLRSSDGANQGTFNVGPDPRAVAFDGKNIWVANFGGNSVTKLSAADGAVLETITVGDRPWGLAFDGTYMWVACYQSNQVMKIRASDNQIVGSVSVSSPLSLAFDGANVWAALNLGSGRAAKISGTGTPTVLGEFAAGVFPGFITFDGTNIWVSNSGSGNLTKLRASDGANMGTFTGGGVNEAGFAAFDGTNLWVIGNALRKLRPSDGQVLATFPITGQAIAFDGANLWVTDQNAPTVTKH